MKKLLTTATLLFTGGLMIPAIAPAAHAQFDDRSSFTPIVVESIPRRFERAFFQNSGDFYLNRTILRQVQFVFGLGYPENEIQDDANIINGLYRELSNQQNSSDPILRSPDIRNPYDTSIQAVPNSSGFTQGGFTLETPSFR